MMHWYFITKTVLTYCEKKLFLQSKKIFEIRGWRPWICKNFEINRTICSNSETSFGSIITMSWELWKHPDPVPGVRPMFFKPKLYKESKNGFKTINYRPSPVMFFSKNCFWSNKIIIRLDILLIFEFLWKYIWIN